jgi:murein DD-endopeptidase MepM/ murein hydrolase activator NlpD
MRLLACLVIVALLSLLPAPVHAATVPAPDRDGAWPLAPRPDVVEGFDPPEQKWGAGHRGVDLLGHVGQPVHTSLGGTVTFAARLAGRGVVVVDHGGVRTTYEPVSASVQVGDPVARGDVIGTLQRASSHCFPRACLHWGLRRGEAYLDPLTLVGAGPIRLLPLTGPVARGVGTAAVESVADLSGSRAPTWSPTAGEVPAAPSRGAWPGLARSW